MFKAKEYKHHIKPLLKYVDKNGCTGTIIAEYCAIMGLPLIIAYQFLFDAEKIDEETYSSSIREIKSFYGIKDVL